MFYGTSYESLNRKVILPFPACFFKCRPKVIPHVIMRFLNHQISDKRWQRNLMTRTASLTTAAALDCPQPDRFPETWHLCVELLLLAFSIRHRLQPDKGRQWLGVDLPAEQISARGRYYISILHTAEEKHFWLADQVPIWTNIRLEILRKRRLNTNVL